MAQICEVVGCLNPGSLFDDKVEDEEEQLFLCEAHEAKVVDENFEIADAPYPDAPANVLVVQHKAPVVDDDDVMSVVVVVVPSSKRDRSSSSEADPDAAAEEVLMEQIVAEEEGGEELPRKKQLTV